jgi:hypothetical protein
MPFSILGSSGELSPVGLGLRLCSLDLECQGCGGEGGYCLLGLRFDSSRVWRCSIVSTLFIILERDFRGSETGREYFIQFFSH